MANSPFKPSWGKFEAGMQSDDPKVSRESSEAFEEERNKELEASSRARQWEKDRKKSIQKGKQKYLKGFEEKEKQSDPIEQFRQEMKTAGVFAWNLTPTEGFIVVQVKELPNLTDSGIYIPQEMSEGMENTGTVVGYGVGALHYSGLRVNSPAEVGDWILFKKGAGIDITLQGKTCRFMRFDDVLGVFDK